MKQHDWNGFTVTLTIDEDGDWKASFVELPHICAFADETDAALEELQDAWNGVKESYLKRGEQIPVAPANKNYSGQFNVRVDRRLHRDLALEAAQAGVSLNALVSQKLANPYEHRA